MTLERHGEMTPSTLASSRREGSALPSERDPFSPPAAVPRRSAIQCQDARKARTATTTAPTQSSKCHVLARRLDIASTRAVAAPPAVELPVSDTCSHAGAVGVEYPREHEAGVGPSLASDVVIAKGAHLHDHDGPAL